MRRPIVDESPRRRAKEIALAAWKLFCQAAERETVTAEMARRVARDLRGAAAATVGGGR